MPNGNADKCGWRSKACRVGCAPLGRWVRERDIPTALPTSISYPRLIHIGYSFTHKIGSLGGGSLGFHAKRIFDYQLTQLSQKSIPYTVFSPSLSLSQSGTTLTFALYSILIMAHQRNTKMIPTLAASVATAALGAAYIDSQLAISKDLRQLIEDRAFAKRLKTRIQGLGDETTLYHMLEQADQSADALWFEGLTWTYSAFKTGARNPTQTL